MTTDTATLAEFLLARVGDDEALARHASSLVVGKRGPSANVASGQVQMPAARVLAQCAAIRAIVESGPSECDAFGESRSGSSKHYPDPEWAGYCDGCSAAVSCDLDWHRTLRTLAGVYASHADFRDDWHQ